MTASKTRLPRGTCQVCGRNVALNLQGTTHGHRPPKEQQNPARPWAMCEGSRQLPKAARS